MIRSFKQRGIRYLFWKAKSTFLDKVRGAYYQFFFRSAKELRAGRGIFILRDAKSRIEIGTKVHLHDKIQLWSIADKLNDKGAELTIGSASQIKNNAILKVKSGSIQIGSFCSVGHRVEILCDHERITIGNGVRIAAEVFISTANHQYADREVPIYKQGFSYKSVTIADDVWIGRRAIILPGVTIGKGAIIAAGAIVTSNIEPYTVVGGIPAKKIKNR